MSISAISAFLNTTSTQQTQATQATQATETAAAGIGEAATLELSSAANASSTTSAVCKRGRQPNWRCGRSIRNFFLSVRQ